MGLAGRMPAGPTAGTAAPLFPELVEAAACGGEIWSAGGGGRTHTSLRKQDFESSASANFATPAFQSGQSRKPLDALQAPWRTEYFTQHKRGPKIAR